MYYQVLVEVSRPSPLSLAPAPSPCRPLAHGAYNNLVALSPSPYPWPQPLCVIVAGCMI